MILADRLRPEDLRTINRKAFLDPNSNYLKSDLLAVPPAHTLKEINNVKNSEIQEAIRAVTAFDEDSMRPAWSHHMSLHCGLHFWPDANHRTAVLSFNLALEREYGWHLGMSKEAALQMIADSKVFRRSNRSLLRIQNLRDPNNGYARFLQQFEDGLTIKPAEGDGGLF